MESQITSCAPALATLKDVTEFANLVIALADSVHSALKRLSTSSSKDPDLGYSVLTEEYAIRARANILLNDSARHTVENPGFRQFELRNYVVTTNRRIEECTSLAELLTVSTDLITFVSAISSGNARILKILAQAFGVIEANQPVAGS
jgi:hypothetical protein